MQPPQQDVICRRSLSCSRTTLLISWFTPLRWCAIPLNSFISSGTNSVPQWRLMMVLGPHYPISQKELVEASGMDKVRISREIHRLVEKGILFTENSVQDKRISLVSFTPAGLTLFQQLKTEAGSWQHTLTDYLPAEARQSIRLHLQSVSDAIEQLHLLDNEQPS